MKTCALGALAQIGAAADTHIWDAHRGCSALAGALLVAQGLVGRAARNRIATRVGSEFATRASAEPRGTVPPAVFARALLRELAVDAGEPRGLGHDVIFAAYALRAIEVFGIDPWPSLLDGLTRLVRAVRGSGPGWITVNGKNEPRPLRRAARDSGGPWATFLLVDRPAPMEAGDLQLGHLLTHGHAIGMLGAHAGKGLAARLDLAYRKRVHALELATREQRDRTPLPRRVTDPRREDYWELADRFGTMDGHVLKYAYSFLDLRPRPISTSDLRAFGRILWPGRPSLGPRGEAGSRPPYLAV